MKPALPWFLSPSHRDIKLGCLALFSLPFLACGLFCGWKLTARPMWDWLRARSWQKVDAVVDRAWLRTNHGSESDSQEVVVEFHYLYQGIRHNVTRYSLMDTDNALAVKTKAETVASLSPGKPVHCWVNPDAPHEAVLNRSLTLEPMIGLLFSIPFVTVGAGGLGLLCLPGLGRRFRSHRLAQLQALVQEGKLPPWVMEPFSPSGGQTGHVSLVMAADKRLPQLLGILLINLFWNGLVGGFLLLAVVALAAGETSNAGWLTVILLPFLGAGLYMVSAAIKHWRPTRQPRWVAALTPVPGLGGGWVEVCWAWMTPNLVRQASMRIVSRATHWDHESDTPARPLSQKRAVCITSAGASGKQQYELAAVDVADVGMAAHGSTRLSLPGVAHLATTLRTLSPGVLDWGAWWEIEVAHPHGELELADLTQAVKLA